MFDEIWDRVFHFLVHPKDLFNARQTCCLWLNLVEYHLTKSFLWYDFHKRIIKIPEIHSDVRINYPYAINIQQRFAKLGALFQVVVSNNKCCYLRITDYLGNARFFDIAMKFDETRTFDLEEFVNSTNIVLHASSYVKRRNRRSFHTTHLIFDSVSLQIREKRDIRVKTFSKSGDGYISLSDGFVNYESDFVDRLKFKFSKFKVTLDVYEKHFNFDIYPAFENRIPENFRLMLELNNSWFFEYKKVEKYYIILVKLIERGKFVCYILNKVVSSMEHELTHLKQINKLLISETNQHYCWKIVKEIDFIE